MTTGMQRKMIAGIALVAAAGGAAYAWSVTMVPPAKTKRPLEPEIMFDDTPSPPLLGASSCFGPYMAQSNGGLKPEVLSLMNQAALAYVTPPNGRRIWSDDKGQVHVFQPGTSRLTSQGQVTAFKLAMSKLSGPERTTNSITAREILRQMMPECNWSADVWPSFGHDAFSKEQYNLWVSVWFLVEAAARQLNYKVGGNSPGKNLVIPKPAGGPGLVIGRGFLALPDVGVPGKTYLKPGRRVQLLVGDYKKGEWPRPPFFHAEPVYARVIDSSGGRPTVEILATFQGNDVAPKYAHRHGFRVGRRLKLPGSGTTGIRKVYPDGVT